MSTVAEIMNAKDCPDCIEYLLDNQGRGKINNPKSTSPGYGDFGLNIWVPEQCSIKE